MCSGTLAAFVDSWYSASMWQTLRLHPRCVQRAARAEHGTPGNLKLVFWCLASKVLDSLAPPAKGSSSELLLRQSCRWPLMCAVTVVLEGAQYELLAGTLPACARPRLLSHQMRSGVCCALTSVQDCGLYCTAGRLSSCKTTISAVLLKVHSS